MKSNYFLYGIETKYPSSKHTGELGVERCKVLLRKMGWIPREINQQNDIGLDLIVEVTKKNEENGNYIPLGKLFGIQIKTGKSYFYENKNQSKYFILKSTLEHKRNWDYWSNHQLPVFIFFFHEELEIFSFFSIDNWAANEEDWDWEEPLPIKSYKLYPYLLENNVEFDDIKNEILKVMKERGDLSNIISLIDSVYNDDKNSFESIMILSKNIQTRSSSIMDFLFPHILQSKDDSVVKESLKFIIDEIKWLPVQMENIRERYIDILNNLTLDIWARILSVVFNHDFYSIEPEEPIVCGCPVSEYITFPYLLDNFHSKFLEIAKNQSYTNYVRINALAICLFGPNVGNYYINNDDYDLEWEKYDRSYLDWKGIHIKDYLIEGNIKKFLLKNDLIDLVEDYYNIVCFS